MCSHRGEVHVFPAMAHAMVLSFILLRLFVVFGRLGINICETRCSLYTVTALHLLFAVIHRFLINCLAWTEFWCPRHIVVLNAVSYNITSGAKAFQKTCTDFLCENRKGSLWSLHWWPEIEMCGNLLSPSKWKFTAATEKRELVLTTDNVWAS